MTMSLPTTTMLDAVPIISRSHHLIPDDDDAREVLTTTTTRTCSYTYILVLSKFLCLSPYQQQHSFYIVL